MKISYEVLKHGIEYVLWKNVETEHGVGSHRVMSGTKSDCMNKLEELNGTRIRKTKSQKRRTGRKQQNASRTDKKTKERSRKRVERVK